MSADADSLRSIVVKLEARLPERAGDQVLNSQELAQFELFSGLRKPISPEKFPGSILLRHYRKGEVICSQSEPGHSAFYIPTREDLHALRTCRPSQPETSSDAQWAVDLPSNDNRQVATAVVLRGQATAQPRSWWQRMIAGPGDHSASSQREFIPNDGPTDIDFRSRQAPLQEGDVFGEMSCMTFAPRSATVVAVRDWYLVEFNRNIFDQLQQDASYRKKTEDFYVERVLSGHLRQLQLFRDLSSKQLQILREGVVRLEVVDPGTVICEEGEVDPRGKPDVFLIRSGVVQIVQGAHISLLKEDITDWPALCQALLGKTVAQPANESEPSSLSPSSISGKASLSTADILAAVRSTKRDPKPTRDRPANDPAEPLQDAGAPPESEEPQASVKKPSPPGTPPSLLRQAAPGDIPSPQRAAFAWMEDHVQQAVKTIARAATADEPNQQLVLSALNTLLRSREFLSTPALTDVYQRPEIDSEIRGLPSGIKGIKKHWSDFRVRVAGRAVLASLFPGSVRPAAEAGPAPRIVAYLSRGDCFGEMALALDAPRSSTCVAYDHPVDDPSRRPGRVELVRIRGSAFQQLMEDSPQLNQRVRELATARTKSLQNLRGGTGLPAIADTPEFQTMGLYQGQSLLLIDLDSCTRCGDCVRACVNTHDDGRSRLFLDGPRFDRFLVPSACRECLNPSCLIGCPVGSILRGDNNQIVIEDWCIGCGMCARQCPYDAIQMHDLGLIAEQTAGWQFAPLSAVADETWRQKNRLDEQWATGISPFRWTLDFRDELTKRRRDRSQSSDPSALAAPVCFRLSFEIPKDRLGDSREFRLLLEAPGMDLTVWINGIQHDWPAELGPKERTALQKRGKMEVRLTSADLKRQNLLAIQVGPPKVDSAALKHGQTVLSARLDPVSEAGELTKAVAEGMVNPEVELVTERAVVCDLCSHLPHQEPACVAQCPHDAAIRVNALDNFPKC